MQRRNETVVEYFKTSEAAMARQAELEELLTTAAYRPAVGEGAASGAVESH